MELAMQVYSDFFKTLHDETRPTGYLGRGTHYSVLRAVVFHDPFGKALPEGRFADFAVIWDEDHDARVMEPIQEIYRKGLLSSFMMFGERKGCFTAILSRMLSPAVREEAIRRIFSKTVDDLSLSVRSYNCLVNANIKYVGDLVQKREGEILRIPNTGLKSLNEIRKALASEGLRLGMEVQGWPTEHATKVNERVALLEREVHSVCQSLDDDPWPGQVLMLESANNPIINDDDAKVSLYLSNLEMLWRLGIEGPEKPAVVAAGGPRLVQPQPSLNADGTLRGWTTDPMEADSSPGS
jgi:Bacterial RNA polymerase, alpha chain C terminal domain